jgi:hypothetical protein
MDEGTVVWLPDGSTFDYDAACQAVYGYNYYACGETGYMGGTLIYCCPY